MAPCNKYPFFTLTIKKNTKIIKYSETDRKSPLDLKERANNKKTTHPVVCKLGLAKQPNLLPAFIFFIIPLLYYFVPHSA